MSPRLAEHIACVPPSGIRKFFDIVSEMKDAISLGVGEPDFVTPWAYSDAAIYSMRAGHTHYTSNWGLIELRRAINEYQRERFGLEYRPENEILVTVGASEGIDLALRTTCEAGDEVLLPDPAYVSYAPIVSLCGGVPVSVSCTAENGFILTPEALEAAVTPRTKSVILAYPNNPTGAVMTEQQLRAILPVIEKYDLLVISDEIYAELTYGGAHCSVASLADMRERTILLSGFSKAFAMTGWRIGFLCSPPEVDAAALKIHQYTLMCAPSAAQYAALEGLKDGFTDNFAVVESMREEYDRRRRFIVDFFNANGLPCFEPRGAFYAYPSVEKTGLTGEQFAGELLRAEKVAVVPGDAFGEAGRYHVRCSYATSMANLDTATERIAHFVKNLRK